MLCYAWACGCDLVMTSGNEPDGVPEKYLPHRLTCCFHRRQRDEHMFWIKNVPVQSLDSLCKGSQLAKPWWVVFKVRDGSIVLFTINTTFQGVRGHCNVWLGEYPFCGACFRQLSSYIWTTSTSILPQSKSKDIQRMLTHTILLCRIWFDVSRFYRSFPYSMAITLNCFVYLKTHGVRFIFHMRFT